MKKEIRNAEALDAVAGDEITGLFDTLSGWMPFTTTAYEMEGRTWVLGRLVTSSDIDVTTVTRDIAIPQDCGTVIEAVVERPTGGRHNVRMMRVRDNYDDPSYWRACAPVGRDENTYFTDNDLVDFTIVDLAEIPF